jgi:hypothetical protein
MRYSVSKNGGTRKWCDGYCSGGCDNPDCESKKLERVPLERVPLEQEVTFCDFCGCKEKRWKPLPMAAWQCDCCLAEWFQDETNGSKRLCNNPKPYTRDYGRGDGRWALHKGQFTTEEWNRICDGHGAEFGFAEFDSYEKAVEAMKRAKH